MLEQMYDTGLPKPKVRGSNPLGSASKNDQPKSWGRYGDVDAPIKKPTGGIAWDFDPRTVSHGYVANNAQIPPESDGVGHLVLANGERVAVDHSDLEELSQFAWWLHACGYPVRELPRGPNGERGQEFLHRRLMNPADGERVDHRNGCILDARRSNLRLTDALGNAQNITSSKRHKRGQFKGVYFVKKSGRWGAGIGAGKKRPNGKARRLHLGCFDTPAEAARAYDRAALEYFGEFASTNFPRVEYESGAA